MAKIAIISQNVNPQVLALAEGLLNQRHDVRLITSYASDIPPISQLEILACFKKWNWLEALQLIPRLLKNPPDVFHFVIQDSSEKPKIAHHLIQQFARSAQRACVVTLGTAKIEFNSFKFFRSTDFLKGSHSLIVPSREVLMYLKRKALIAADAKTEVILPFRINSSNSADAKTELKALTEQCLKWQPYLLIPSQPKKQIVEALLAMTKKLGLRLIFIGERSERVFTDLRLNTLSNPSPLALEVLTQHARAVLVATHEYETAELMSWQKYCSAYSVPMIAHRRQCEMIPGLCLQDKNGFILEQVYDDLKRLLDLNPQLQIRNFIKPRDQLTPIDQSLNEINRLYASSIVRANERARTR